MREYLDGLLPLLAGQAADAVGETVTTRGALQIPGAPTPDVYIAALGPQMLRLAGRRTAGTLTWMTGPKTLAEHVGPTLREAAAEAGRPETAVRVAASLPVSVTDDVAARGHRAAEEFAIYGQLPSYRAMLDREGYAGPEDAAIIGDENTVLRTPRRTGRGGRRRVRRRHLRPLRRGRARTRALLRTKDSYRPKFLWCDRSHRRTVDRTTGSGVTDPKCRHRGESRTRETNETPSNVLPNPPFFVASGPWRRRATVANVRRLVDR